MSRIWPCGVGVLFPCRGGIFRFPVWRVLPLVWRLAERYAIRFATNEQGHYPLILGLTTATRESPFRLLVRSAERQKHDRREAQAQLKHANRALEIQKWGLKSEPFAARSSACGARAAAPEIK